jgi:predicted metal-binding protein
MKKETTPWSIAAVLICTKCHKAIKPSLLTEEGNCGENLKTFLKSKMREAGKQNEIRVMTSSCQNVCEPDTQAVTFVPVTPSAKHTETFVLHPENEREELLNWLLKHD